jgi:hypothetical protein
MSIRSLPWRATGETRNMTFRTQQAVSGHRSMASKQEEKAGIIPKHLLTPQVPALQPNVQGIILERVLERFDRRTMVSIGPSCERRRSK